MTMADRHGGKAEEDAVDHLNPVELQRWSCYVDEIDDEHVHLVMADETTDQGDTREYGSFPRKSFDHMKVQRGLYVTVRVMSDERIVIEPTPITHEQRDAGRRSTAELVDLLKRLGQDWDARETSGPN